MYSADKLAQNKSVRAEATAGKTQYVLTGKEGREVIVAFARGRETSRDTKAKALREGREFARTGRLSYK